MVDADHIARARATSIETLVATLRLRKVGRELAGACPRCGGHDRFAVHLVKQVFHCRGCLATGDVIALVQFLHGVDFPAAVGILVGTSSISPPILRAVPPQPAVPKHSSADDRLALADAVWREAAPITAPGIDYFTRRGISLDDVPDHGGLRFHSHCPWLRGTAPCVIARFTDVLTCRPLGIHRRPITGGKPMSLGPIAGGVIRLWPDEDVIEGLVIGEGIETVLAAATRITHKCTLLRPAWAAGSAGNMASFPVLSGIEALTLIVDNDASGAGQRAAQQCADRWSAAGREVTLLTPRDLDRDLNDLIR